MDRFWIAPFLLMSFAATATDGPCQAASGCLVVGLTPDCDAPNLGTALDDLTNGGFTEQEIRAVVGNYPAPIDAINRNLYLRGGYASCADARAGNAPPRTQHSQIAVTAGTLNIRPLRIGSDVPSRFSYAIERFDFGNGNKASITHLGITGDAGGGVLLDCPIQSGNYFDCATVALQDVTIGDNIADQGGGIAVRGGQLVLGEGTLIGGNFANNGGGLACFGGVLEMTGSDARISYNVAERPSTSGGFGGGLLLVQCATGILSGGYGPNRGGVIGNEALTGGGIAQFGGSMVLGNAAFSTTPAVVADNVGNPDGLVDVFGFPDGGAGALLTADDFGGASGALYVENALITGNRAGDPDAANVPGSVGGIHFRSTGQLRIEGRSLDCTRGCVRFENNRDTALAGALRVSGRDARVDGAVFFGNQSPRSIVTFSNTPGSAETIPLFINNVLFQNGGAGTAMDPDHVVQLDGQLSMYFNTLADNETRVSDVAVLSSFLPSGSTVDFRGNILRAANAAVPPLTNPNASAVFGNCNAVHPAWKPMFQAIGNYVEDRAPDFVAPELGDYRLQPVAYHVDACGQAELLLAASVGAHDAEGVLRPFDYPGVSNFNGPFDIGAYETIRDDVFKDGFE